MRPVLLGLSVIPACLLIAGCGEMPVAPQKTTSTKTSAKPQMLPPPPAVPADAYPSVAAALAEAEAAATSGQAEDQPKRVRVEQWLNMQGAKIEPELSAVVKDTGAGLESRVTACRVLARMGAAATPTLMEATSCETKQVRLKAIESLGRIKPPTKEIVEKLIALLDEPDFEARKAALAGLGAIGPPAKAAVPSIVEKLTALLNNLEEEDTIRTAAHAALKKIDARTKLAG
jgi:HEAT repeat protein